MMNRVRQLLGTHIGCRSSAELRLARKDQTGLIEQRRRDASRKENRQLVQRWLKTSLDFDPSADDHIKKCTSCTERLDIVEQDKIVHIFQSKVFQGWLCDPRSPLLYIEAETAPTEVFNFLSVSTASLASTLSSGTEFATLSFFCDLAKSAQLSKGDSGVLDMLKSLSGQMLAFILDKHPDADLPFTKGDKLWRKSSTSNQYAWELLKSLLLLLPDSSVVFILLNSISRVSGDKTKVDTLVQKIVDLATDHKNGLGVVIKVLVTDALPTSRVRKMAKQWHSLYVPDDVEGWRCGFNHRAVHKENVQALQDLKSDNRSPSPSLPASQ